MKKKIEEVTQRVIDIVRERDRMIIPQAFTYTQQHEIETFNFIASLLTELLSNAEGEGWISVEERLPEDWKKYPVRTVWRSTGLITIKMSHLNPAKSGFYVEFSDDGDFQLEDVTDWFDLPSPPSHTKGERV